MISWKLKNQSQRPIGLDIGHNSIKMIQLAVSSGHISVLAADKVRIDPGISADGEERRSFVISAIKQMLAGGNFRGRNVVSCLPNDELNITSLRLAEAENENVEELLRKEVAQRFGLDSDKDIINYVLAGSVRQADEVKNEWIVFAADNETIRSHIEMLEKAQLRPVAIDTVPCALFRNFEKLLRRREDKEHTVVFVDVGNRFTTVMFGRGGEISFVKQIPIGEEKFDQEIAARLGVGINGTERLRGALQTEKLTNVERGVWVPTLEATMQSSVDASTRQVMVDALGRVAEELGREISLCFKYYTVTFRGKRVERAVFGGGEAYENILLNTLRRQLAVEIEVAQPLSDFDVMNVNFDNDKQGLLCDWAVAVGLSLKGWEGAAVEGDDYEGN